jgi:hypothetical protein
VCVQRDFRPRIRLGEAVVSHRGHLNLADPDIAIRDERQPASVQRRT